MVVQTQPLAYDTAGQVDDRRVVEQHELGVGAQQDGVQLEGEPVRVLRGPPRSSTAVVANDASRAVKSDLDGGQSVF